jgi:copper homeostasis protein
MGVPVAVELCVDSVESARAAQAGGATRIELCSDLGAGGITPSAGLIAMVRRAVKIPVQVLIRPRAGDFAYSAEELEVMRRDIVLARQFGVKGIVLGMLEPSGVVDVKRTAELVQCARPLDVTFHRAFDRTPDLLQALDAVKQAGVQRILTAGGGSSAEEGLAMLARLVREAGSAVAIMAAGGIRAANVAHIVKATGVP